jgi:hypothetical protein
MVPTTICFQDRWEPTIGDQSCLLVRSMWWCYQICQEPWTCPWTCGRKDILFLGAYQWSLKWICAREGQYECYHSWKYMQVSDRPFSILANHSSQQEQPSKGSFLSSYFLGWEKYQYSEYRIRSDLILRISCSKYNNTSYQLPVCS